MTYRTPLCALALALAAGLGQPAWAQRTPESVPAGPFETNHLMIVAPAQEAPLKAAVAAYNREFAEQGCGTCNYRLFKLFSGSNGKYNYLMRGQWPGRDGYIKVHAAAAFAQTTKDHPVIEDLAGSELYGRYVEVK